MMLFLKTNSLVINRRVNETKDIRRMVDVFCYFEFSIEYGKMIPNCVSVNKVDLI